MKYTKIASLAFCIFIVSISLRAAEMSIEQRGWLDTKSRGLAELNAWVGAGSKAPGGRLKMTPDERTHLKNMMYEKSQGRRSVIFSNYPDLLYVNKLEVPFSTDIARNGLIGSVEDMIKDIVAAPVSEPTGKQGKANYLYFKNTWVWAIHLKQNNIDRGFVVLVSLPDINPLTFYGVRHFLTQPELDKFLNDWETYLIRDRSFEFLFENIDNAYSAILRNQ